jgi:hypothetical protein
VTSTLPPLMTMWVLMAVAIVLIGGLGFPWWLVVPLYGALVFRAFTRRA